MNNVYHSFNVIRNKIGGCGSPWWRWRCMTFSDNQLVNKVANLETLEHQVVSTVLQLWLPRRGPHFSKSRWVILVNSKEKSTAHLSCDYGNNRGSWWVPVSHLRRGQEHRPGLGEEVGGRGLVMPECKAAGTNKQCLHGSRIPKGLVPVMGVWEMYDRQAGAAPAGILMLHRSVVVKRDPSWKTVYWLSHIPTLIFAIGCGWLVGWWPDEYDHKYKLSLRAGCQIRTPHSYSVFWHFIQMSFWEDKSRTCCRDYKSHLTVGVCDGGAGWEEGNPDLLDLNVDESRKEHLSRDDWWLRIQTEEC